MSASPDEPFCVLRPMTEADVAMVLEWRNHPDVRRHMFKQAEIPLAEHERWFRGAAAESTRNLLIFEVDDIPRGFVNIHRLDVGEATWGFYLAPDAPKGTGRLLGRASTDFAFGVLHLEKLWGEVLPGNAASHRFHLRQGFELQSVVPEKMIAGQRWENVRRYLLTRGDWLTRQEGSQ